MHYLNKDNGGNGGIIVNMASAAGKSGFKLIYQS
jgi:hypothetical protein